LQGNAEVLTKKALLDTDASNGITKMGFGE
jgi:hypothetical protein